MAIDLNSMSAKELESLISQAKKRRTVLSKRKPVATVRRRLEQIARAEGYSIDELFGNRPGNAAPRTATRTTRKPAKTTGTKVAPKFRNPSNPEETWTGRGKQPRWLAAYTSAGHSLEEFRITDKT